MTAPSAANRRRFRWAQFGLRSLLLLMLLSAMAIWWWSPSPETLEHELADGTLLRAQVRYRTDGASGEALPRKHGSFEMLAPSGRRVCQGYYVNDLPAGNWTYYHANGRPALQGACRAGRRVGVWTEWYEDGQPRAEIEYAGLDAEAADPPDWLQPAESRLGVLVPELAGVRHGTARRWWENGRLRWQGHFADNQSQGTWTFWNRAGRQTAAGSYQAGQRHGKWRVADASPSTMQPVFYVRGARSAEWPELLPQLGRQLAGGDEPARFEAARLLAAVGPEALPELVPVLQHPSPQVCRLALQCLSQIGPPARAALPAIVPLTGADDRHTAAAARCALLAIDVDGRAEMFLQILQRVASEAVESAGGERGSVLDVYLAHLRPQLLLPLTEAALDSPEVAVRHAALRVLAAMVRQAGGPAERGQESVYSELLAILERATTHDDQELAAAAEGLRELIMHGSQRSPGGMF